MKLAREILGNTIGKQVKKKNHYEIRCDKGSKKRRKKRKERKKFQRPRNMIMSASGSELEGRKVIFNGTEVVFKEKVFKQTWVTAFFYSIL